MSALPRGWARTLALTGILAGVACILPSEPVEQLDLSLSLSTTRVHADTGVIVTIAAANYRRHPVVLETTGGCVVAYRITGPDGEEVRPGWGHACASILKTVIVVPGDSAYLSFRLLPTPNGRVTPVWRWRAGTYEITGLLLDRDLRIVDRTPPVAFTLTCRDPAWEEC